MRTLSNGLGLAIGLFLMSSAVPPPVGAVALFDTALNATLIIQSTNPLLLVQNVSATQGSGDSATPGTDATATASALATGASLTINLATSGQTGAIVPATASAFAEGTLFFSLVNTDLSEGAQVTLGLATTGFSQIVSVDDPAVESARLDSTLELEFVQMPGANVIVTDSRETPPNDAIGPISSQIVLTELIFFAASSVDVSLHLRVAGEATATAVTAVPEPDSIWPVTTGLAFVVAIAAFARRSRRLGGGPA